MVAPRDFLPETMNECTIKTITHLNDKAEILATTKDVTDCGYTVKKGLGIFPSAAGMSLGPWPAII